MNFADKTVESMFNSKDESLYEEYGEVYEDYKSVNGDNIEEKNTTGNKNYQIDEEYEQDYEEYRERYQEYGPRKTDTNDTNDQSNDENFRKKQKLFFYCWWFLLIIGWSGLFLVVGMVIGIVEQTGSIKIKRRALKFIKSDIEVFFTFFAEIEITFEF